MAELEKVIAGLTMLADTKNDDSCEGLKCCKIAEDALELLKAQKWTSIKERYPDKEGFYLVSADHGNYLPWIAEMKIFGGVKGFCNGATMPCVGAWMPLPQPYVNDNYLR